ncbi:MAG TPA: alkene reductase [Alphaproteobacteria bacterium]|nr:alkene reductase [Alphaproteobacteria bacterium]
MTDLQKNTKTITETNADGLLSSAKLGPYNLKNRMVMAPLTRNRAAEGNVPQDINVTYYRQRASAGLIVSEGSQISPHAVGYPGTPGIHDPEQIAGWKRVTGAVHENGGRIFLQLWHTGRISHPSLLPDEELPVAPSAIRPAGETITFSGPQPFVTPRALELGELPAIVGQYRQAAQNAQSAGFDGVEIHAANGYLPDQFLRDGANQRTDAYGGSIENRTRFLLEITDAVTGVWGSERVGVRLSPINTFNDMSDSDPGATFGFVVEKLNPYGLAYLHVVEVDMLGAGPGRGYERRKLRDAFDGPYIANGGYDRKRGNLAIADGDADLVSFGRLFLANPDLPERFASDAALNEPDQETFYGGDERGYTDYPFLPTKD